MKIKGICTPCTYEAPFGWYCARCADHQGHCAYKTKWWNVGGILH